MTATLTTLVSFNGANGAEPMGDLIADANGDLFGTTSGGGAYGDGTVFEIAKAPAAMRALPRRWSASTAPMRDPSRRPDCRRERRPVRHDCSRRRDGDGTVFEIAKTAGGYASTPTTLVSFNGPDGSIHRPA